MGYGSVSLSLSFFNPSPCLMLRGELDDTFVWKRREKPLTRRRRPMRTDLSLKFSFSLISDGCSLSLSPLKPRRIPGTNCVTAYSLARVRPHFYPEPFSLREREEEEKTINGNMCCSCPRERRKNAVNHTRWNFILSTLKRVFSFLGWFFPMQPRWAGAHETWLISADSFTASFWCPQWQGERKKEGCVLLLYPGKL